MLIQGETLINVSYLILSYLTKYIQLLSGILQSLSIANGARVEPARIATNGLLTNNLITH